jgi:hypothetical protein
MQMPHLINLLHNLVYRAPYGKAFFPLFWVALAGFNLGRYSNKFSGTTSAWVALISCIALLVIGYAHLVILLRNPPRDDV